MGEQIRSKNILIIFVPGLPNISIFLDWGMKIWGFTFFVTGLVKDLAP